MQMSKIRTIFSLIVLAMALSLASVVGAQEATAEKEGCLFGQVWFDANRNGVQDENEDAMDGASVLLLNVAPFRYETGPYTVENRRLTRDGGIYEFCELRTGIYELRVTPPAGVLSDRLFIVAGSNPVGPIDFEEGDSAMANFGFGFPHVSDSDDSLNQP